jgi:hypothetical protein
VCPQCWMHSLGRDRFRWGRADRWWLHESNVRFQSVGEYGGYQIRIFYEFGQPMLTGIGWICVQAHYFYETEIFEMNMIAFSIYSYCYYMLPEFDLQLLPLSSSTVVRTRDPNTGTVEFLIDPNPIMGSLQRAIFFVSSTRTNYRYRSTTFFPPKLQNARK